LPPRTARRRHRRRNPVPRTQQLPQPAVNQFQSTVIECASGNNSKSTAREREAAESTNPRAEWTIPGEGGRAAATRASSWLDSPPACTPRTIGRRCRGLPRSREPGCLTDHGFPFSVPSSEFRNQFALLPRSPEPERLWRRNQEPGNVAWVSDNGEGRGESG